MAIQLHAYIQDAQTYMYMWINSHIYIQMCIYMSNFLNSLFGNITLMSSPFLNNSIIYKYNIQVRIAECINFEKIFYSW